MNPGRGLPPPSHVQYAVPKQLAVSSKERTIP
jgi:hypothetical protein